MKKLWLINMVALAALNGWAQQSTSIDPDESVVEWLGSSLFQFNDHYGTVRFSEGEIHWKNDSIVGGDFVIDMNTIVNTDGKYNELLVQHLKSPDFFDVAQYPRSRLIIVEVHYLDAETIEVKANLTIRNITRMISFPSTVSVDAGKTMISSRLIIDRSLWEIRYGSSSFFDNLGNEVISDAIKLEVQVVADRREQR